MELIAIGKIRTSHGVRGFVKIISYSGETEHFFQLDKVILRTGNSESVHYIEEMKPLGDSLIIKFRGIESPEKAKQLSGMEIFVDRQNAVPLEEGEYYHADLYQCSLYFEEELIGHVKSILEGGGGELFEIQKISGETVLIPFREEFIGEISVEKKRIELKNNWILG